MKKIYKILTALLGSIALSATAAPIAESKAVFPQQCLQLFKETENLIAQAEKQPGTHTQVGKIKSKLNQSKQQILEMELATQQKSCDVACFEKLRDLGVEFDVRKVPNDSKKDLFDLIKKANVQ